MFRAFGPESGGAWEDFSPKSLIPMDHVFQKSYEIL